ncbi:hypothetical protein ACA910_000737 [Epithemia clementina (nom. ined.)]
MQQTAAVEPETTVDKKSAASDAKSVSPYSKADQWEALNALLKGSNDPEFDARHIYGYGTVDHEPSMLQTVTATRLLDFQKLKSEKDAPSQQQLEEQARAFRAQHGPVLNLQTVIQKQAAQDTMALAAEFKRASPSKGLMASDLSLPAAQQTSQYAQAGANIISVLTEPRWFLGSFDDLTQTRLATAATVKEINPHQERPAILCKEFIAEEYLIAQAAAAGADTCLLIVAVIPQQLLQRLIEYARSLDMEPLVEVHTLQELDVALAAGAIVIGVNNRNLHTFQMDLSTSEKIAADLTRRQLDFQTNYTLCALSGMSSAADVHRYRQAGLQMCLIGESLMRSPNPSQAIASLCLNAADYENFNQQASNNKDRPLSSVSGAYTAGLQLIKVCGITKPEDATVACQAGANLIGVILAEKSKRKVSPEQAKAVVAAVRAFGERPERHDFARSSAGANGSAHPALLHLLGKSRQLAQGATSRRPLVVGVFQNQEPEFIAQMVQECGFDLVQLHGNEGYAAANPEKCGGVPAIRVVDIYTDPTSTVTSEGASENSGSAAAVEEILSNLSSEPMVILLDTAIKGASSGGGTSTTFDWTLAQAVQNAGLPVLVAGGLTPDNVVDCVTSIRPFGVDVSSGVEKSPGVKDHDSVRNFVQSARQASNKANQSF